MIRYSCHSENFGILSAEHTFSLIHDLQFDCIDIASRSLIPQNQIQADPVFASANLKDLSQKYEEETVKKQEYEDSLGTDVEASALIEEELAETNVLLGLTDVEGPGIEVILNNNSTVNIDAYDLLELVNELRLAGAEAISINGERIVSMSEIVDINYSFIVVNGNRISSPYTVKAIGNQTYLESGLTAKEYGYMDNIIKGNNKTATLERKDVIHISKFTGKYN